MEFLPFILIFLVLAITSGSTRTNIKTFDHNCPECGHKWDNPPTTKKTKRAMVIVFTFMVLVFSLIGFMVYDMFNRDAIMNGFWIDDHCEYQSENWKVVEEDGYYTAVSMDGKQLLYSGISEIYNWNVGSDLGYETWFKTECKAKGLIVAWVEQEKEKKVKLNRFKP